MTSSSIVIQFYTPDVAQGSSKESLVAFVLEKMREDGNIKRAGYSDERDFEKDLLSHIGPGEMSKYKQLIILEKVSIEKIVRSTAEKCHEVLPHPDLPIFVFVYPWFPTGADQELFQGTTAFATYYTIHIFINLDSYSQASLKQTIAHEWNHLVYCRYHEEKELTLLDHLVMEGMAEIFREELIGGSVAPWSKVLNRPECLAQIKLLKELFGDKSRELYKSVFWENNKHLRWTGYSVGYLIAKEFRKRFPKLSWEEIVKISSENIMTKSATIITDD